MNSKEFFGKIDYVRGAYVSAKRAYEDAVRFDFTTEGEKATPHLTTAARLVAESIDKLAADENFYQGLKAYIDDVQASYQEVLRLIKDLDEFLKAEYGILINGGYSPGHALELVQNISIAIGAVYALTHPDQIEALRKGLSRASRAVNTVTNSIERNIGKESLLPKALIKTARPLAAGFEILGGGVLIYESCASASAAPVTTLVSIGSGIVGIANRIEYIDMN